MVAEALLVRLAALLARRQPGAVLGRVPLPLAVAADVLQQQRAADSAVLLVLHPVAGELRLRALGVEAEAAELLVLLRGLVRLADGRH